MAEVKSKAKLRAPIPTWTVGAGVPARGAAASLASSVACGQGWTSCV